MEQAYPSIPGYDVLTLLGAGASARVWRARRLADDRMLAVKVLPVRTGGLSEALREAAVLSRVRHDHVVHLYDVVPLPGPDGQPGAVALAMQLAEGGSLAGVLAGRGHLSAGELVTLLVPLAGALADLHRSGVVHGDVSPGNVLFLGDGMPMLADLGVCRVAGETPTAVHGTDGMVAPELLEGFPPGPEADVYALGAVAWTCLVGDPPGWVGTRGSLAELAPEVPEALRDLVLACLEPEPADRPDAEEVAALAFDAAPAEPIELGPGADPAAGLTQRIRRAAAVDPFGADDAADVGEPVSRRDRRARGRDRERHRRRSRILLGSAVAAVLLPLSLLGVRWAAAWVLDAPEGVVTSEGTFPDGAVRTTPPADDGARATGSPPAETTGPAAPPEPDEPAEPEAPTEEPESPAEENGGEVAQDLQDLLDARAAAWRAGDPSLLARVHAPDSVAWQTDRADLTEAADRGLTYRDLAFTASGVTVLEPGTDGLVVRARVERSAYEVVGDGRSGEPHPGSREEVTFELRRVDGQGWRIWSWAVD